MDFCVPKCEIVDGREKKAHAVGRIPLLLYTKDQSPMVKIQTLVKASDSERPKQSKSASKELA